MKQLELEKIRLEDKVMRMQSMVMHEQTARVGNDDNIIVPYVLLQECMMTSYVIVAEEEECVAVKISKQEESHVY